MKKLFITLTLVLVLPVLSNGWGFFAHKTIAQVAIYTLPSSMQAFYFRHMEQLVKLSIAPDERRETDDAEAPRHFIDMDHFGDDPFNDMPKAWDAATAKYTADTLRKYGTVPWTVLEVKEKLTEAFRQRDTTAIIALSADLCHYVADAYVPLHTTVNYDGQLSNQTGMHSLWEVEAAGAPHCQVPAGQQARQVYQRPTKSYLDGSAGVVRLPGGYFRL